MQISYQASLSKQWLHNKLELLAPASFEDAGVQVANARLVINEWATKR